LTHGSNINYTSSTKMSRKSGFLIYANWQGNMSLSKWSVLLLAAVMSSVTFAQAPAARSDKRDACEDESYKKKETIAELRDLKGNVLVSDPKGIAAGADRQRLANKVRVSTTARSGVLIRFDCGCDIELKENERLDVEGGDPCAALLAAIKPVPVGVAVGAATVGTTATAGVAVGAIAVSAGVGTVLYRRNRGNVSPN
jgi:hypothetical protein